MLLHPFGELSPALQIRFERVLEALDGLTAEEDLEVACQLVVALLKISRPRFAGSPDHRVAFDGLCDAVVDWFRREVNRLRFVRMH
jgi:hypothetical protein